MMLVDSVDVQAFAINIRLIDIVSLETAYLETAYTFTHAHRNLCPKTHVSKKLHVYINSLRLTGKFVQISTCSL